MDKSTLTEFKNLLVGKTITDVDCRDESKLCFTLNDGSSAIFSGGTEAGFGLLTALINDKEDKTLTSASIFE